MRSCARRFKDSLTMDPKPRGWVEILRNRSIARIQRSIRAKNSSDRQLVHGQKKKNKTIRNIISIYLAKYRSTFAPRNSTMKRRKKKKRQNDGLLDEKLYFCLIHRQDWAGNRYGYLLKYQQVAGNGKHQNGSSWFFFPIVYFGNLFYAFFFSFSSGSGGIRLLSPRPGMRTKPTGCRIRSEKKIETRWASLDQLHVHAGSRRGHHRKRIVSVLTHSSCDYVLLWVFFFSL